MENNKDKVESINKLASNDECIKKILSANNGEEVKKIFKDQGLDLTDEQIENLKKAFADQLIKLNTMPDKELEKVGGGMDLKKVGYAAESGVGHGGAYGMWVGAGIGAAAGVVDASIKAYRGGVDTTWGFMKEAFKIAVKSSIVGGAAGGGLGLLSGSLNEVGKQGEANLSKEG